MTSDSGAPWVVGNWKMNATAESADRLASEIRAGEPWRTARVALCPPFVYLPLARRILAGSEILLGAQDCAAEEGGAFTGEVSAAQLADVGCRCVLIGHSERRRYQREQDAELSLKLSQAARHGLLPVFCVGETLEERKAGQTEAVVSRQLEKGLGPGLPALRDLLVAYEPVWAIGTGVVAQPEEAEQVHGLIRRWLSQRAGEAGAKAGILYGGSVKADNAAGLLARRDVGGLLVGGASLSSAEFLSIARSAGKT